MINDPTSPLGDRWFRDWVSSLIPSSFQFPPTPHPSKSLEEGFSPPPTSSPGLWTGVSRGPVTTYIRFCRHPGHHHFFIIFATPFYIDFCSMLAPKFVPKSLQNPLKIDPKSDLENYQHFSQILHRILMDPAPPRTLNIVLPSKREATF